MVHYRIEKLRKAGKIFVFDISEYIGNSCYRRTTVTAKNVIPFIESVFSSLPEQLKELKKGGD